ncbi:MAG: hypothetical protein DRO40_11375 [Thermoprotei archaeon]|nr:MAG: hypothetical protein DRO40_11375 [Thermoprotei archaeon]
MLEVGVGGKILSSILRQALSSAELNIKMVSLDINSMLVPDVQGDVRQLPFKGEAFNVSLCFETLEHIPSAFLLHALKS